MAADSNEVAIIETKFGKMVVEFYDKDAPKTIANFKKLAKEGFYNGTTFHRVIPGFMIQGGDPNSKNPDRGTHGSGGPGYTIDAEISPATQSLTAKASVRITPRRIGKSAMYRISSAATITAARTSVSSRIALATGAYSR